MTAATKRVYVTVANGEYEGAVSSDANLDDLFTLTLDDGEKMQFKGWLCEVNSVDDEAPA